MKELQEILKTAERLDDTQKKAVLATVVDVRGSSYRLPGAKMLILGSGETFGTISGGCLEADVLERAKNVLACGVADLFVYDTGANPDSIFSLSMGCRGVIRILLEPLAEEYTGFLRNNLMKRRACSSVTVIGTDDPDRLPVGSRFFLDETGTVLDKDRKRHGATFHFAQPEGFNAGHSQTLAYDLGDTSVELYFEYIEPALNLLIFGAGADAVPLAALAGNLGWSVSLIDHRPAFATSTRFPNADNIFLLRPENLNGQPAIDESTVAVVMTHNYNHDKQVLRFLLRSRVLYIGALGPKRRTEELLSKLRDEGETFSDQQLGRLFAPVGLDIGATTPETIALSIAAEIHAFVAGRAARSLRERQGSIYDDARVASTTMSKGLAI